MAAMTITANIVDARESISVASGGTPGSRAVTVIIDNTKVTNPVDVYNLLLRIAEKFLEGHPNTYA